MTEDIFAMAKKAAERWSGVMDRLSDGPSGFQSPPVETFAPLREAVMGKHMEETVEVNVGSMVALLGEYEYLQKEHNDDTGV